MSSSESTSNEVFKVDQTGLNYTLDDANVDTEMVLKRDKEGTCELIVTFNNRQQAQEHLKFGIEMALTIQDTLQKVSK